MKIIRTVKLKLLNGEFDTFDEKEKFILSLFNNLSEKTAYGVTRLVAEDGSEIFHYDLNTQMLFCTYHEVWCAMSVKFDLTIGQVKKIIEKVFLLILNATGYIIVFSPYDDDHKIDPNGDKLDVHIY